MSPIKPISVDDILQHVIKFAEAGDATTAFGFLYAAAKVSEALKREAKEASIGEAVSQFVRDLNRPEPIGVCVTRPTPDRVPVVSSGTVIAEAKDEQGEKLGDVLVMPQSKARIADPPTAAPEQLRFKPGILVVRDGNNGQNVAVRESGRLVIEAIVGSSPAVRRDVVLGKNYDSDHVVRETFRGILKVLARDLDDAVVRLGTAATIELFDGDASTIFRIKEGKHDKDTLLAMLHRAIGILAARSEGDTVLRSIAKSPVDDKVPRLFGLQNGCVPNVIRSGVLQVTMDSDHYGVSVAPNRFSAVVHDVWQMVQNCSGEIIINDAATKHSFKLTNPGSARSVDDVRAALTVFAMKSQIQAPAPAPGQWSDEGRRHLLLFLNEAGHVFSPETFNQVEILFIGDATVDAARLVHHTSFSREQVRIAIAGGDPWHRPCPESRIDFKVKS